MRTFIKRLIKLFKPKNINSGEIKERQIQNSKLRAEKKTDLNRWQDNNELFSDWNERTLILGSYILPNASIIEFGAGNMVLKDHIQNYKKYIPTDIVARFEETIICDLNKAVIPEVKMCDTAVFSGVLEYVYDIDRVFNELGENIKQVVLSYCCADIVKLSRDKNGWLSDYKKNELEQIFKKNGFIIENYTEWREQSIFNLLKKPDFNNE